MPALLPTLVLCYAAEDEAIARELAAYLRENLPYDVSCGECVVSAALDLIDAAERALSAEAALILLSAHSVPKSWDRSKWEPVFFGVAREFRSHLGFVQLGDCRFPELFRRQHFFDARLEPMTEARRIRQWLLRPEQPVPKDLPSQGTFVDVAERAGIAEGVPYETAHAFARDCAYDFEQVHHFDFGGRTVAGMLGDIGQAVGLSLPGTVEENRQSVALFCLQHRILFVISNGARAVRELAALRGRASVIYTVDSPSRALATEEELAAAFLVFPRDEAVCGRLFGDGVILLGEMLSADFAAGLRLGWALVSFAKGAKRFAETVEILDSMESAARDRGDSLALRRIEWEQCWLRETSPSDGVTCILPTAAGDLAQLSLFG